MQRGCTSFVEILVVMTGRVKSTVQHFYLLMVA
jgi:hypothetical protein